MTDNNTPESVNFLMILNNIDWFWSHRLPLAHAIIKRGWKLHLATHGADMDPNLSKMGVRGCPLPPHGKASNILGQLILLWAMAKTIKQVKPDIIHAVTIRYAFYAGLVARIIGYKPIVFTVAGLGNLYTAPGIKFKMLRFFILPLFRFVFGGEGRSVIFQNPDDQRAMVSTNIVDQDRTCVIRGSGVNIKEFSFTPYVDTGERPIILFASRLLKEKGIADYIEAARLLKQKGVNARFVIAGEVYPDNPRSLTKEEVQGYHDEGVIEWLGRHDDMPALINQSMMMVLPSYYGEGVPKVLLESAAIGRPIITCDAPGCREAVEHEVNGLLIPPQSPQDLADAIESLINDPEKRLQYGAAGRKRVEEDFHSDAVVEQTMAVYDELLNVEPRQQQPLDKAA